MNPRQSLTSRAALGDLLGVARPLDAVPEADLATTARVLEGVTIRGLTLWVPGGSHVPCLYLEPAGHGPWPGAVAVHQHNREFHLGKSEPAGLAGDPDLAYGLALARRGVAVVVPDLLGFEGRRGPLADGTVGERLAAFGLLARGSSLQARHVEDVALCVSWLLAQDDVTDRIGLVGHSLGGQVAFFATACDERIDAAVLSCGLGTLASFDLRNILHNPAWYVPDLVTVGDTPAVAALAQGQAVRVCAGRSDPLFPLFGVEEAVAGFPSGVAELHLDDGGHAFPPEAARPALAWLEERLGVDRS